jgi:aminopeptidase N
LEAGRAFILSLSPEYQVSSTQVGDVTVYGYYFQPYDLPNEVSLSASAKAVDIYSRRYGPYPHKTLSIIMGEFNDGMEFSASYFTSRAYYDLYQGDPSNSLFQLSLEYLAVHETSHQWWFEKVANDQAIDPWLDESLATYSERVYFETYAPDQLSLWWYVRSDQYNPQGPVDIPIYEGGGFRPYTNATYFRGAHFLEDLRARIGDEAFFAFLQDYAMQMDGKIATPGDFFAILRQHTDVDFSDVVATYFANQY